MVAAWPAFKEGDQTTIILSVKNGGETPIEECTVSLGPTKEWFDQSRRETHYNFHTVPAGDTMRTPLTADFFDFKDDTDEQREGYMSPLYVLLDFTDAEGYRWSKGRGQPVKCLGRKNPDSHPG